MQIINEMKRGSVSEKKRHLSFRSFRALLRNCVCFTHVWACLAHCRTAEPCRDHCNMDSFIQVLLHQLLSILLCVTILMFRRAAFFCRAPTVSPGRAGKLIEHWAMRHFHRGSTSHPEKNPNQQTNPLMVNGWSISLRGAQRAAVRFFRQSLDSLRALLSVS